MKLSIIVPCYNCQKNILNLLNSIVAQSIDGVEVILINDGSSDNTEKIIGDFINHNGNLELKLISTPNQGAALARKLGLENARGEYVFFCDSDDMLSESFVEIIFRNLDSSPDIIYFSSVQCDEEKKFLSYKYKFNESSLSLNSELFLKMLIVRGQWTAAVWTYVFKRKVCEISGADFTLRNAHEDHLFSLKLLLNSNSVCVIPDILYYQVVTVGSLTNSKKNFNYIYSRFQASKECISFLESINTGAEIIYQYKRWTLRSIFILLRKNPRYFLGMVTSFSFLNYIFGFFWLGFILKRERYDRC